MKGVDHLSRQPRPFTFCPPSPEKNIRGAPVPYPHVGVAPPHERQYFLFHLPPTTRRNYSRTITLRTCMYVYVRVRTICRINSWLNLKYDNLLNFITNNIGKKYVLFFTSLCGDWLDKFYYWFVHYYEWTDKWATFLGRNKM